MSSVKKYEEDFLKRFEDHKLTIVFKDGPSGIFLVKKENTIIDSFQILSGPLGLAITGDLDEYTCYEYKSWKWLRGARDEYLAGKLQLKSYLCVDSVRNLIQELEVKDREYIEEYLSRLYEGQLVSLSDFENHDLLGLIYENLEEIPTMYDPFEVGKLNAMTKTFDRLLTKEGL